MVTPGTCLITQEVIIQQENDLKQPSFLNGKPVQSKEHKKKLL